MILKTPLYTTLEQLLDQIGILLTNGGRVLSIVSRGKTMDEALKKSYETIDKINFEGKTFRKDIGFDL